MSGAGGDALRRAGEIRPEDLHLSEGSVSKAILETDTPGPSPASLDQIRDLERTMILQTLASNGANKAATARELGIPIATLWRKLKAYRREPSSDLSL
jgi:DNA-binding NtrC family response regulator